MRVLHLDCPAGLGGDMFLAALAGLGLDLAPLAAALGPAVVRRLELLDEKRGGIAGLRLEPELAEAPLRRLQDVLDLLDEAALSESVRSRSAKAMARLAEVEAAVHGIGLEEVHFHEVGAADTVLDIAGAFWALEMLGVERVTCSDVPWFSGRVRCAHGDLPLPAPATVKLLEGKPVRPSGFECELVTPTGALLLDQCVDAYLPGPQGRLLGSSLAYGSMDLGPGAGLRACLLEAVDWPSLPLPQGAALETVWVLESNVDHLSGEDLGYCFDALLEAGALDVAHLPAVMKKNRPGGVLQAICAESELAAVQDAFFRSTLTLGLRRRQVERIALPRTAGRLHGSWGEVAAKTARYKDETWTAPEYDALRTLARSTGKSPALLRRLLLQDDTPGQESGQESGEKG